ncbi:methylglutaconyl-CoA hydratase [Tistlia consotensis]|uniref:Methylglutaconyl-CoA hydratase n=1 Tax=Tistlia consotensis USBA 355 TaxID=560819 RepID=A0A1Y6CK81_9PROT|nr:crotonase/enoyl-CoA hydratase family protein [Tistlia consotensis]SMF72339.1 methylglutaconyl-CoA hydratase [Tistlia consotensis USBA 355]SNS08902.1 methylglutaconyl-CoA hydratase [Tistlia consotensis]
MTESYETPGTFETLKIERDARGVATLALDRPEVHNAFDETVIAELHRAAEALGADPAVRVVVLTGEGRSFSAGGDLRWFRRQIESGREERLAGSAALAAMLRALDELPKPLIGRINGGAYGGGTGLMAVCDVAIGVEGARFGLTEVRLGLLPANISPFVIARIGAANARRVMLSGRRFEASEAVALGLLKEAVPADRLDAAVEAEVAELLLAAPGAIAATKRLIRQVATHGLEDNLDYTARALADAWETEEGQEGIAAFLEKRKPGWQGA